MTSELQKLTSAFRGLSDEDEEEGVSLGEEDLEGEELGLDEEEEFVE